MGRLTVQNKKTELAELVDWTEEEWEEFMGSLDVPVLESLLDAVDKLAEYEDLEEQGLLLRLPCPIGTTVYLIDINDYFVLNEFIEEVPFELSMFDYVGKYVFLTKPEAEEALKKMQEG